MCKESYGIQRFPFDCVWKLKTAVESFGQKICSFRPKKHPRLRVLFLNFFYSESLAGSTGALIGSESGAV